MTGMQEGVTNKTSGVDYDAMDPFKVASIRAAMQTDGNLERFRFKPVSWSRGESAFLIETPWGYLAFVLEGLGTKNLVADCLAEIAGEMHWFSDRSFYDNIGICNAATAFNDVITSGAQPIVYNQYLAVGDGSWFDDEVRRRDLIAGTRKACDLAGCTWGGGETPTLRGIIIPGAADLAGSTTGIILDKRRVINPANIQAGDAIVIVESSGIHANGLSMARQIAARLPKGYLTEVTQGKTYGELLLEPTHIYAPFVGACLMSGVDVHYAVNVSGHGFRKLMRATQPFAYLIEHLPAEQPLFAFMQKHGNVDDAEAYASWNMGAGFALYVPEGQSQTVIDIAHTQGFRAFWAGRVENGEKKVIIRPKRLEYSAETLKVR